MKSKLNVPGILNAPHLLCFATLPLVLLAAPSSHADNGVQLYGEVRESIDSVNNGRDSVARVSSDTSRLGLQGAEPLGNGINAIFQLETAINLDDGAGKTGTLLGSARTSFAGLNGPFGTVVGGLLDTPYRQSTHDLDVFNDTLGDYRAIIGSVSNNSTTAPYILRSPNALAYWSPTFKGLQVKALYGSGKDPKNDHDRYSASLTYLGGPVYALIAYEKHRNELTDTAPKAPSRDTSGLKGGLGLTFGNTRLDAIYERLSEDGATGVFDRSAWYVNAAQRFGSNSLRIAYGHAGDNGAKAATGASFYAVGASHNLSKRTELYALYARTDNDANATYELGSSGTSGATLAAAPGKSVSGFSIGINHEF